MNGNLVMTLPLPILTCLLSGVVAVLALRLDLGKTAARIFFMALFALFAVQAFFVGLRFGYSVEDFILIQRLLPLLVGPLMYLGFLALSLEADPAKTRTQLHLAVSIVLIVVCSLVADRFANIDWIIGASYIAYAILLFRLWRRGPDALIHAPLDLAQPLTQWMLFGAGMLVVLLILDSAIALSFAMERAGQAAALISFGSTVFAFLLILAMFAISRHAKPRVVERVAQTPESDDAQDTIAAAQTLLIETELFLDPELNVQRLARRLHIPARTLSTAVNGSLGMNVSQWVNGFRLNYAADLLKSTKKSVTEISTQSGFLTRSNFYREFQRVYGQSPASYRKSTD